MANLYRKIPINFRVTEAERDSIKRNMEAAGIRNKEAYIRKMTLDGYIFRLDLRDITEMTKMLSNAANILNQIAKRINSGGEIFASDVKDIQDNYELLDGQANKILRSLAKIQK